MAKPETITIDEVKYVRADFVDILPIGLTTWQRS